jgi:hypothetical protein
MHVKAIARNTQSGNNQFFDLQQLYGRSSTRLSIAVLTLLCSAIGTPTK